mgnify:CR=1 FL=1
MKDFYEKYYQAESSGHVHSCVPQKGRGFFGRVVRSTMQPLVQTLTPYVKEGAIDAGKNILKRLSRGESLSDSVSKGVCKTVRRCKRKKSTGSGLKKKKHLTSKKSKSTRKSKSVKLF